MKCKTFSHMNHGRMAAEFNGWITDDIEIHTIVTGSEKNGNAAWSVFYTGPDPEEKEVVQEPEPEPFEEQDAEGHIVVEEGTTDALASMDAGVVVKKRRGRPRKQVNNE